MFLLLVIFTKTVTVSVLLHLLDEELIEISEEKNSTNKNKKPVKVFIRNLFFPDCIS